MNCLSFVALCNPDALCPQHLFRRSGIFPSPNSQNFAAKDPINQTIIFLFLVAAMTYASGQPNSTKKTSTKSSVNCVNVFVFSFSDRVHIVFRSMLQNTPV
jgi:hypothetical protein